jgi:hypothetical protein
MGGPFMQFTTVDGSFTHMMGGGIALILSDFWIGGYGIGTTNQIPVDRDKIETNDGLNIGHGGFWMGYSLFGDKAIHVSLSSLVGWGSLSLEDYWVSDPLFAVVPTLEVEFNITQFFRISTGATYNLYTLVNLEDPTGSGRGYKSSDISGPGGFLAFKFGWFY